MEHHNKQEEGPERLMKFMSAHYRVDTDFGRFIVLTQLVQASALKCAVEHWRRRKYMTAGALFWQLNDCWPVASWSVIDSALRPKAAYYYARRFFAPVLVSVRSTTEALEIWVTNDRTTPVRGVLRFSLRSFDGEVSWSEERAVEIRADTSQCLARTQHDKRKRPRPDSDYLLAELLSDDREIIRNRHYFAAPKHLNLPDPGITWHVETTGSGRFLLHLSATRLARDVSIAMRDGEADFADNYFDIDAGGLWEIRFTSPLSFDAVRANLRLDWLR